MGSLEKEFAVDALSFRLGVILRSDSVKKWKNCTSIREAMRNWIKAQSHKFQDGHHTLSNIPGIPFQFQIIKKSNRPPGIFFSRTISEEATFADRVRSLIDRKAEKLEKYQNQGKTTILLIESNDLALMNESVLFGAIKKNYPEAFPKGVDQIWYADTSLHVKSVFSSVPYALQGKKLNHEWQIP